MVGNSPWGPGKGPKKFLEKLFLKILKKKECFENTYMVSRCRRGDGYI